MDGLVEKKFDFKKREIKKKLEEDILQSQHEFSAKGTLHSGMFFKRCYILAAQSAQSMIDALLMTYEEVGKLTGEEIVLEKENEVLEEVSKLAVAEGNEVHNYLNNRSKILKMILPEYADKFSANFQNDSRKKAEILIETTKRRIQNNRPKQIFTDEAFLIMQIGDSQLDKIWRDVYVPVIQDFKLKPRRIDKHNEGRFLMSEVASLLDRSKIIIADLTNARPNCYLEVGYTYGVEKNNHLILCAREDHNSDSPNYKKNGPRIHFDISGYDILFWDENKIDDFKTSLAKKLKYRLEVIEK